VLDIFINFRFKKICKIKYFDYARLNTIDYFGTHPHTYPVDIFSNMSSYKGIRFKIHIITFKYTCTCIVQYR
jgi:hypothetical protein